MEDQTQLCRHSLRLARDRCIEINLSTDGKSLTAIWKRWVVVGTKAGDLVDPGLVSEVNWTLEGKTLRRKESLTASKTLNVRRLWLAIPSRYDHLETLYVKGARIDRLFSEGQTLAVQVKDSTWPLKTSAYTTGNAAGPRRPWPSPRAPDPPNQSVYVDTGNTQKLGARSERRLRCKLPCCPWG